MTARRSEPAPPVATITVHGTRYDVVVPHAENDYIQNLLFTSGEPYEREMLEAISHVVGPGDLVLDIGANVGNHTLYLAAVCGCDVVAYEPNRELTAAIDQSLQLDGLQDRVTVRSAAVGSGA